MLGHRTSNFLFRTFQKQQKSHFHMTKVVENDLKVGLVGIKNINEKNHTYASKIFFRQIDLCTLFFSFIVLIGMGHVGNAVCNNLLRKGYNVTAMNDIKTENCRGFPDSIAVKNTAREVAEMSDIVVSGM